MRLRIYSADPFFPGRAAVRLQSEAVGLASINGGSFFVLKSEMGKDLPYM